MTHVVRHPHAGCAIVPPELLRRIAARGTVRQRDAALATLATDQTLRLARATYELLERGAHRGMLGAPATAKVRTIFDARSAPSRMRVSDWRFFSFISRIIINWTLPITMVSGLFNS